MTFSIAARCRQTGAMGMAIASSSPAVAARCAHARAGAGVVASQNVTDPRLGQRGLDLLETGLDAAAALAQLCRDPQIRFRQLVVIDRNGGTAHFTGGGALGVHAVAAGEGVAAAGNLLATEAVPAAMVAAFLATEGALAERLLRGLEAGLAAGGEAGPVRSAGLLVVRDLSWPLVDLRSDWEEAPITRLRAAWDIYRPQCEDYVQRALAPDAAPSFGVPGNE